MSSKVTPQAIADYLGGMPVKEVLEKYDISRTQFYRRLKQESQTPRGPVDLFTSAQVSQMAQDYTAGLTIDQLIEKYGGCQQTISSYLKDAGCHIRTSAENAQVYSAEQIDQVIANYLNNLTAKKSGEWCGASEPSVFRWLKDRNINRRHQPNYGGTSDFFQNLDTEEKLYWFGFLCADGNLRSKKYVRILLSRKDDEHLQLFHRTIAYKKPIARFSKVRAWADRPAKEYHYSMSLVGSAQMVCDLARHGMRHIKHGDASKLYRLNDDDFRHFLRGYFDGDGSINRIESSNQWCWMICGPDRSILEYMCSRCPAVKRWNSIKHGSIWRVAYQGNRIVGAICRWLYKDATVFLPRKKLLADRAIAKLRD